jgi:ribosomal-protein-alanine N-acetyltransferase
MSVQDLDAVVRLAEATGGAPTWSRLAYEAIFSPSSGLHRFAWTSRCEKSLSGFAVASWLPQEREADLETVVVDPRYRRQGQASALLRACMLAAAQAGAQSMRLEVRASNTAALALYHQNGFASIGTRRSYYSAPVEDALLLQRPL